MRFLSLAILLTIPASYGATDDLFTGTWKLDSSRMRTQSAAARAPILHIDAEPAGMTLSEQRTSPAGEKYDFALHAEFGGKINGVISSPEIDAVKCWRSDSHKIVIEFFNGGSVLEWWTAEVSKGGKALKITSTATGADGKEISASFLYEKQ